MENPYSGALNRDFHSFGRIYFATNRAANYALPEDDRTALAWLPTLVCVALGGTPDKAQVAQSAWALLYGASDAIDQVQDGHVCPPITPAQALSAGVGLIFAAAERLGSLPATWQAMAYARLHEMLGGQAEDVIKERPTYQEALTIAEKKAGAFMGLGCSLGALSARVDDETVAALDAYGRALGTMIQIHDDLDLIEGLGRLQAQTPERYSNLALSYTWTMLDADRRQTLANDLEAYWTARDDQAAQRAYTVLVRAGARLMCVIEAGKHWDRARKAIDAVRFKSAPEHKVLLELIDGIVNAFKAQT